MPQRIEADPSKPISRVVAEKIRNKTVSGLVEGNGDDHRDRPDCDQKQHVSASVHCGGPLAPYLAVAPEVLFGQVPYPRVAVDTRQAPGARQAPKRAVAALDIMAILVGKQLAPITGRCELRGVALVRGPLRA